MGTGFRIRSRSIKDDYNETRSDGARLVPLRVRLGVLPVDALFLQAEADAELSVREGPDLAALPWRACVAPLPERRGTLHRLQALRGDLPAAVDHHSARP